MHHVDNFFNLDKECIPLFSVPTYCSMFDRTGQRRTKCLAVFQPDARSISADSWLAMAITVAAVL